MTNGRVCKEDFPLLAAYMTYNQLTPCTTGMESVCACSRYVLMPYELMIYVSAGDTIFIQAVLRGNSPIYYRQRIGKHAFANSLPLQYFVMYGNHKK